MREKLGGWPLLNDKNFTNSMDDIDKLIALRLVGVKPFFDLSVSYNPKKPGHSVLRVSGLCIWVLIKIRLNLGLCF